MHAYNNRSWCGWTLTTDPIKQSQKIYEGVRQSALVLTLEHETNMLNTYTRSAYTHSIFFRIIYKKKKIHIVQV